jgi:hypothetical protein
MNVVGAPRRIIFTLPAVDVVGSSAVYLAIQPPVGSAFDRLAVYDSVLAGINTYHADITTAETTAGGAGIWRVMPKIVGSDTAAFPKYDDSQTLDFELQWDTGFNAAALITPTKLREHISTALSDSALIDIISAEEQDIIARYGSHTSQVEEIEDETPGSLIFPRRPVSSITNIVEVWPDTFGGGSTATTLAANDYEIVPGGREIHRLSTGTHPLAYWGNRVTITYVPVVDTAKRIRALIDLCKLTISATPGLKSESVGGGEYSYTAATDIGVEREKIYARLDSGRRGYA